MPIKFNGDVVRCVIKQHERCKRFILECEIVVWVIITGRDQDSTSGDRFLDLYNHIFKTLKTYNETVIGRFFAQAE